MPETDEIACTLDAEQMRDRGTLMATLGRVLSAVSARDREAFLEFPLDSEEEVTAFVRAESACCQFFDFDVTVRDRVELRIGAPEGAEWAVRGLVAGFVAGWAWPGEERGA